MSFSDRDAAQLVSAQYIGGKPKTPQAERDAARAQFDVWVDDTHPSWRSVSWAAKVVQDYIVFVLEGSHDGYDWANDGKFLPVDVKGAWLHSGFWANMNDTWESMCHSMSNLILTGLNCKLIFVGHSKGAANADILAWLAFKGQYEVTGLIRWGEPAPSYNSVLGEALQAVPIRRSYINQKPEPRWPDEQDPIPALPLKIFGAKHPDMLIPIYSQPPADDLNPLKWHHFARYLEATPETVILP